MDHFVLAVYDSSPDYINLFLAALRSTKDLPFEVTGFTSPSALGKYVSGAVVNILLLSLSGDETEETEINKILCHENIKKTVYLGEQPGGYADTDHIYKYQSIRSVISELLRIWNECGYNTAVQNIRTDIYGVYSLENTSGRICLALDLARSLNCTGHALYIETERFSGLKEQADNDAPGNLSDIIYLYKTDPARLPQMLPNTVSHIYGTDVITGSAAPEDLDEAGPDTWADIFQALASTGGYDTFVMGISDSFRNIEAVFSLCRSIYLLVPAAVEGSGGSRSSSLALRRMKEFDLFFAKNERGDILEKIITIDTARAAKISAVSLL